MAKTKVTLTPHDVGAAIQKLVEEKRVHSTAAEKLNAEIAELQASYEKKLAELSAAHVKAIKALSDKHRGILEKSIAVDESLEKLVNTSVIDEHA